MSYMDEMLLSDEHVLHRAKMHKIIWLGVSVFSFFIAMPAVSYLVYFFNQPVLEYNITIATYVLLFVVTWWVGLGIIELGVFSFFIAMPAVGYLAYLFNQPVTEDNIAMYMALFVIAWWLGWIIHVAIEQFCVHIVITNKRIVCRVGFIYKTATEMELTKVETVQINQGLVGRMTNYGNITITGSGGSSMILDNVQEPLEIQRCILESLPKHN